MHYLFKNIAGCFVFDENYNLLDKALSDKGQSMVELENRIRKKFPDLKSIDKPTYKILSSLKNEDIKDILIEKNIQITKQALTDSVKKDTLIIQAVKNIDDMTKNSNMMCKRLREWYALHNPELENSIDTNEEFVNKIIENKNEKIKESIGADFSKEDLIPLIELANTINSLYEIKKNNIEYITKLMQNFCPNLLTITGALIGAKLLELAGSLKKLALFPSSTIQLLGAESALFRHLRFGKKPPKHGIILQHPIVSGAGRNEKGKAARNLANKISISARIDFFKGDEYIGYQLKEEIEKKFK